MHIAKTSFDAIAHHINFPDTLESCLRDGLACILPYDSLAKGLGDMVAAMENIEDAKGYARQLQMRRGQSFWTVTYDSETDYIKIHY